MMKAYNNKESGLTLVELIVVAALLVLMTSIIFGTITGIIRTRNQLDSNRQATNVARYAIQRISQDLRNRVAEPLVPTDEESSKQSSSSSSSSASSSYMIGKNQQKDGADSDVLRFITLNGAQAVIGGASNFGRVEVLYELAKAGKLKSISDSMSNKEGSFVLIRQEAPAGIKKKELREQSLLSLPIAENVAYLNFRYYTNGKWLEQWGSGQAKLPDAIEIALGVFNGNGTVTNYKTAIMVNYEIQRRTNSGSSSQESS